MTPAQTHLFGIEIDSIYFTQSSKSFKFLLNIRWKFFIESSKNEEMFFDSMCI